MSGSSFWSQKVSEILERTASERQVLRNLERLAASKDFGLEEKQLLFNCHLLVRSVGAHKVPSKTLSTLNTEISKIFNEERRG